MCMKISRLFEFNKRDYIGLACWFVVGLVFNLLAIPVMIIREVYQWKHYHLNRFEWEDVVRYSIVIAFSSLVQYLVLGMLSINL
jgi:hypothetical protein